jgi:hypothetical protein
MQHDKFATLRSTRYVSLREWKIAKRVAKQQDIKLHANDQAQNMQAIASSDLPQ